MSKRLEGIEGLAPEDRWTMLWWGVERIDLRRALRWVQSLRHTIDVLTVTPTPEAGTVFWMRVSDRQTAPGPGDLPARGRDTLAAFQTGRAPWLIEAVAAAASTSGHPVEVDARSAHEPSECRAECRRSVATRLPAMRQEVRKIP